MPESGLDGVFTADKIWDAVSGGWTGTGESQAAVHVQLIWLDETEMSVGHACKSLSSVSFTAPATQSFQTTTLSILAPVIHCSSLDAKLACRNFIV